MHAGSIDDPDTTCREDVTEHKVEEESNVEDRDDITDNISGAQGAKPSTGGSSGVGQDENDSDGDDDDG
jgi:hypothetical protein